MLITERLLKFQPACSRTIRNAGAFVRGSHHRRCKREGITSHYDALLMAQLQVGEGLNEVCQTIEIGILISLIAHLVFFR